MRIPVLRPALVMLAILAGPLAASEYQGPHSATGELEGWPWQLQYEALVVEAGARPQPTDVRSLTLALEVVPRPGPRELQAAGRGVLVDLRVGATVREEFPAETPVWCLGVPFDRGRLTKGQRIRLWCCTSTAPKAPGTVIEVLPAEPRKRR